MTIVIPLAVAGALALIGFMASRKDSSAAGPALPDGTSPKPKPGTTPAGAAPANPASAPAGSLPSGTTPNTGDAQTVHADDTFDEAVAKAIAAGDINALIELAKMAEAKGLLTVAKSIRDEIARLQQAANHPAAAPIPTPPKPDKPPVEVVHTIPLTGGTYIVKAGDTGEKIAQAYTGNKSRWTELLAPVNPNKKRDPKFGIALYTGERINLPASWPSGVPVIPPVVPPSAPPVVQAIPPAPTPLNTYTVVKGDTGERVAIKFVNDKSRWRELLTVNPTLKSAQYGIALYTGHKINLPSNWPAVPTQSLPAPVAAPPLPAAPIPVVAPTTSPIPESDARMASRELTDYLTSLGGLAGRYKEDRTKIKGYQTRLGTTADGSYGKGTATIVIQNGYVPVAPYYWSKTTATTDKNNFLSMVRNYAAADPQRKAQWDKLIADTIRS